MHTGYNLNGQDAAGRRPTSDLNALLNEDNIELNGAAKLLMDVVFESKDEEDDADILEQLQSFRGDKPVRIENYYESVIPRITDTQFQSHFRMTRDIFVKVEEILSPLLKAKINASKPTIIERKQILMVIWLMANQECYRSVGERFDIAKSSLWSCFYRVIRALNLVSTRFLYWPNNEERNAIAMRFGQTGRLPNVSGAIDGTYIPIKAPKENPEAYINRKCFHGISLQIIADTKLKITDCFTGYPSSVADARIFRNSDFFKNVMENPASFFDDDQFIIGDKAYPVLNWCIPPYVNRGQLNIMHTNFNSIHAKMRQCVERTFALLYGRIRRLQHLDMNKFRLYAYVIKAGCVLHNMCLLNGNENLEEYIREGLPVVANNQDLEQINNIEPGANLALVNNQGKERRDNLARQLL